MVLGFLSIVAFLVAASLIWLFRPDRMVGGEAFRIAPERLPEAVALCQRAGQGRPVLTLRPFRRRVSLRLEFQSPDRVLLTVPLVLKKQQAERARLEALLAENGREVVAYAPDGQLRYLRAVFSRTDADLPHRIAALYAALFEASPTAPVNMDAALPASDRLIWTTLFRQEVQAARGRLPTPPSARHDGKTAAAVMRRRYLIAAQLFLYPPLIVAAHAWANLVGVMGVVLVLSAGSFVSAVRSTGLAPALVSRHAELAMIATIGAVGLSGDAGNARWLMPVFGASVCAEAALGLRRQQRRAERRDHAFPDRAAAAMLCLCGAGIAGLGVWADTALSEPQWVRLFAYLRIELIMALALLVVPAVLLLIRCKGRDTA